MGRWLQGDVNLRLRPLDHKFPWVLLAPISFLDDVGDQWDVPAGFLTDLASLPPFVPFAWDRVGAKPAAVLHDYLYCEAPCGISRESADTIFYEAMLAAGVKRKWAVIYWIGVRVGGWKAWDKYRRSTDREWYANNDREA